MPFTPFLGGQLPRATLGGAAGFSLPNTTSDLLTWTAPNDGQTHLVMVIGTFQCTTTGTGGLVVVNFTQPNGTVVTGNITLISGGRTGGTSGQGNVTMQVQPGTVVAVHQQSALSAGAEVIWADILST